MHEQERKVTIRKRFDTIIKKYYKVSSKTLNFLYLNTNSLLIFTIRLRGLMIYKITFVFYKKTQKQSFSTSEADKLKACLVDMKI